MKFIGTKLKSNYMENLLFGLLVSIINTLAMRFVANGEAAYASGAAFATTMVSVFALVHIVQQGAGALWYALGVACGVFLAIRWDIKRRGACSTPSVD